MSNIFANPSYTIAGGTAVSGTLEQPHAIQIACGRVWLTIEGDDCDYWLSAGESLNLPAGRLVVIEADRQASLIETVARATPALSIRRAATLPVDCQAQAA